MILAAVEKKKQGKEPKSQDNLYGIVFLENLGVSSLKAAAGTLGHFRFGELKPDIKSLKVYIQLMQLSWKFSVHECYFKC